MAISDKVGEVQINSFNIGSLSLTDSSKTSMVGFNIYESILDPLGPVGEVRFFDSSDSFASSNINGKEDVTVSFKSATGGEPLTFKFKAVGAKNDDRTDQQYGNGKNKQMEVRFCSPEMNNAQGNYVEKSYNTQTSSMVEQMLKNYLKTDKQIDIQEQTKGVRRLDFKNEHFMEAYDKLNHEHVSSTNESSCFTCFVQGGSQQKYVFTTFEKLFQQGPTVTLKQTNTLAAGNAGESDLQNSIMWFKAPDTFYTPSRPMSKAQKRGYDPVTGYAYNVLPEKEPKFVTADGSTIYSEPPSSANSVPTYTHKNSANDKNETYVSDARKKRAMFLSHLAQNSAELEIPGNTSIKLGSMINLDIPNKSADTGSAAAGGEKQINGKALVVAIRHKIKPAGQTPRYTMVLRVVKASYKQGGGGIG